MLTNQLSGVNHKLNALADPRRRQIFEILSTGPRSVADISRGLPVTRPAVSQHLKVLLDAGLVRHRVEGTRHLYRLDPTGVGSIRDYMDSMWQRALENLKVEVERAYEESKLNQGASE